MVNISSSKAPQNITPDEKQAAQSAHGINETMKGQFMDPRVRAAMQALAVGVDVNGIELNDDAVQVLRVGNNVVLSLADTPYVARISPEGRDLKAILSELYFTTALAQRGVKVVTAATGLAQNPVQTKSGIVTFWNKLESLPTLNYQQFGQELRNFHEVSGDIDVEMPTWDHFTLLNDRLELYRQSTSSEDVDLLLEISKELEATCKQLISSSELGVSTVHGDAYTGNTIQTKDGVYLCDFERVATGAPLEWDLIPEAVVVRRLGGNAENYHQFCKGYGRDVMEWEHFQTFALMRELRMTTFLFQNSHRPDVAKEIDVRMRLWRDHADTSVWTAK